MRAEGAALAPTLMHVDADGGEFHIKVGGLRLDRTYFAPKANGGFFGNREAYGLPNVIGLIILFDGACGRPLAVMDSIDITILRTVATTAVAARRLARPDSATVTICGCGNQGRVQLKALAIVICFHLIPTHLTFIYQDIKTSIMI
jgi:ornithine cyclodeaminase/alanine dehydrogenase